MYPLNPRSISRHSLMETHDYARQHNLIVGENVLTPRGPARLIHLRKMAEVEFPNGVEAMFNVQDLSPSK